MIEERDLIVDLNKTTNTKNIRLLFNTLLTLGIFTMVIITGFYPLALLVFATIWDLKNIKRQTLPTLTGSRIPLKNISSAKFIFGKLGFHQIDLLITNDEGKQMQKTMRLYDSKNEIERALNILSETGFTIENPMDAKNEKLKNASSLPSTKTKNYTCSKKR